MSVVDSHHHFWWIAKHTYRWPDQAGDRLDRDFTPTDLFAELEACGIAGSVLIQVLHETGETGEYLDIQRRNKFVRGVVGWVPLADPAEAAQALDELPERGKLVGIRHLISNEPNPEWLLQDAVQDSLQLMSDRGLVLDTIPINERQLDAVITTARRLPDLQIVINHLGRPPVTEEGWEPWATQVVRASHCPNVSMKLSVGLDVAMRWTWSTEQLRRYADHALEAFTPARMMAASNWPVILLAGSYQEIWSGTTELVGKLSADEKAAVLGGTAERIYGL